MKKTVTNALTSNKTDLALLVARIAVGAFMLTHGLPKLVLLFSGGQVQFPGLFGMSPELSLGLAVFAEVFCSLLVIAGFGTRLAVVPLISTMLVAVFYVHAADPFARKETAAIYLVFFSLLLLTGGGKYSVDYWRQYKSSKPVYAGSRRTEDYPVNICT